jgi:hypothetical protein
MPLMFFVTELPIGGPALVSRTVHVSQARRREQFQYFSLPSNFYQSFVMMDMLRSSSYDNNECPMVLSHWNSALFEAHSITVASDQALGLN